jgi:ribulose 1,5-bisphosphate carboxylase large subunit-like protein
MSDTIAQPTATMLALSAKERADAAYHLATKAIDSIKGHEDLCAERYNGFRREQEHMADALASHRAQSEGGQKALTESISCVHGRIDALKDDINKGALKVLFSVLAGAVGIIVTIWKSGMTP